MKLSIKLEKYDDHSRNGKCHMFEISVDNPTSTFEAFDVTSIDGIKEFLDDINAAKQAIEDYLCEHD
jgi:hypothetical protein